MKNHLVLTADGSHTIYVPDMDEHYHSVNGAIKESETVFINPGISFLQKNSLIILEIGFGTGLNALLTLKEATRLNRKVSYIAVEKYPVSPELIDQLNYTTELKNEYQKQFEHMHSCDWGRSIKINSHFTITKFLCDVNNLNIEDRCDIIYFDPFAQNKQPQMWTNEIINKVCSYAEVDGLFLSYSVAGNLKRQLKVLGFKVEGLPGPPGKREITRAQKKKR